MSFEAPPSWQPLSPTRSASRLSASPRRHDKTQRVTPCTLCGLLIGFNRKRCTCDRCGISVCEFCATIFPGGVDEDAEGVRKERAGNTWCGACCDSGRKELYGRVDSGKGVKQLRPGYFVSDVPGGPVIVPPGNTACFLCGSKYSLFTWKTQCHDCRCFTCDSCCRKLRGMDLFSVNQNSTPIQLCNECYEWRCAGIVRCPFYETADLRSSVGSAQSGTSPQGWPPSPAGSPKAMQTPHVVSPIVPAKNLPPALRQRSMSLPQSESPSPFRPAVELAQRSPPVVEGRLQRAQPQVVTAIPYTAASSPSPQPVRAVPIATPISSQAAASSSPSPAVVPAVVQAHRGTQPLSPSGALEARPGENDEDFARRVYQALNER